MVRVWGNFDGVANSHAIGNTLSTKFAPPAVLAIATVHLGLTAFSVLQAVHRGSPDTQSAKCIGDKIPLGIHQKREIVMDFGQGMREVNASAVAEPMMSNTTPAIIQGLDTSRCLIS